MRATRALRGLVGNRDTVTDLMRAGESCEPFVDVEDAINGSALSENTKAALWLYAFSMRDPREQQSTARAYLASVS
jgi:hypothetical protein